MLCAPVGLAPYVARVRRTLRVELSPPWWHSHTLQVASLVRRSRHASEAAERLVQKAIKARGLRDDTSVMVIVLGESGRRSVASRASSGDSRASRINLCSNDRSLPASPSLFRRLLLGRNGSSTASSTDSDRNSDGSVGSPGGPGLRRPPLSSPGAIDGGGHHLSSALGLEAMTIADDSVRIDQSLPPPKRSAASPR